MATFLSEAWLAELVSADAALPPVEGATLRVQHVVPKAPGGEVAYTTSIEDGRVVAATLGPDEAADLVVTTEYRDAVLLLTGELAPDVAFMQGRLKVAGSMGDFLRLIPVQRSEAYRAGRAALGAATDLPG